MHKVGGAHQSLTRSAWARPFVLPMSRSRDNVLERKPQTSGLTFAGTADGQPFDVSERCRAATVRGTTCDSGGRLRVRSLRLQRSTPPLGRQAHFRHEQRRREREVRRPGEVVALTRRNAELLKSAEFGPGLDAFGHDDGSGVRTGLYQAGGKRLRGRILAYTLSGYSADTVRYTFWYTSTEHALASPAAIAPPQLQSDCAGR